MFLFSSCEVTSPEIVKGDLVVLSFSLTENSQVKADVINSYNTLIKNLIDRNLFAGVYRVEWDLTDNHNNKVVEGTYFFELYINNKLIKRQLIILVNL